MNNKPIDGMVVLSLGMGLFFAINIWRDRAGVNTTIREDEAAIEENGISTGIHFEQGRRESVKDVDSTRAQLNHVAEFDHDAIAMPYSEYVVTQGPHGYEYGHLAVDISAGKGADIHAPITGVVVALFTDEAGGTIMIIENNRWQITLVHGIFSVEVGELVQIGQVIGVESNQGKTVDMEGRSCRGRDCGYHTHVNFFDKLLGENINPLELFPQDY